MDEYIMRHWLNALFGSNAQMDHKTTLKLEAADKSQAARGDHIVKNPTSPGNSHKGHGDNSTLRVFNGPGG